MSDTRTYSWMHDAEPRPRKTVTITGHPGAVAMPMRRLREVTDPGATTTRTPRMVAIERRRPAKPVAERMSARPDRVALWAFLMALTLVLVTLLSANGA